MEEYMQFCANVVAAADVNQDGMVTKEEFIAVYEQLAAEGVPVRSNRDQAWRDFAGWRVNYDQVLLGLCALIVPPTAPWSSDRGMQQYRPRIRRR